jgi:phospholipid/cholesterol/gamma-HCH transport system substrate-binding protein
MNARVQALRVGVVAAVSLVVLAATVFYVGQEQRFFERKVRYMVQFRRTNGLQVGAPVALTGVPIGTVEAMAFPRDVDAQYIVVHIRVSGDVAPRIRENSIASVHTLGLLGDKFIELSAGTAEAQPLKPGSVINSLDPVDYEAVLGQSGDIIANIIEVTSTLKNVLQSIDRGEGLIGELVKSREDGTAIVTDLRKAVSNVERSTASASRIIESVEGGEGAVGVLLKDSKRMQKILARLEASSISLDKFTTRLQKGSGALPRLIDDEAYGQEVLGNVQRTTANLAAISDKVNRGEGTLGAMVNDPTLYQRATNFLGGSTGWAVRLYRGARVLWPFGGGPSPDGEESAPPAVADPGAPAAGSSPPGSDGAP